MSRQMPELYMRGAIFNKTMKNLTQAEMDEVEECLEKLLKTPSLTKSREKFCQTLANTIGADYREDKQAALQEYKIALMKAIIYVLFHKPNRQVLDDPIQTRKLFSQFTYNYMKQILNENKIPRDISDKYLEGEPCVVVYEQICNVLKHEKILHTAEFLQDRHGYIIEGDIGIINLKTAKKIGRFKSKYSKMGVQIVADTTKIEIVKTNSAPDVRVKIRSSSRIRTLSFENDSKDRDGGDINRYNLEYAVSKKQTNSGNAFDPTHMRKMMPNHLTDIFDIIIDTPDGLNKDLNKNQVAKHLNISLNEVNKRLDQMKYFYYVSKSQ